MAHRASQRASEPASRHEPTQASQTSAQDRRRAILQAASQAAMKPEMIFYDGTCALCHGAVKFVLRRDRDGSAFRFAPLQGETFRARVAAEHRAALPDSLVVLAADGSLRVRSEAIRHILRRLGGGWKILAAVMGVVPSALRDAAYDGVAALRYRVFGRKREGCPAGAPEWRARFDP